METDEGLYYATPQTHGRFAHETIDNKKASNRAVVSWEQKKLAIIRNLNCNGYS